jgi:hypothetical protein
MKAPKLDWLPVSEKTEEAGTYLVWSHKKGLRLTDLHPSWWNNDAYPEVCPVTKWCYIGPLGMGYLMRSRLGKEGGQ